MNLKVWISRAPHPLESNESFTQFYENTHINTYRYVMACCGGVENLAEDITAEAYLRGWKNRKTFSGNEDAALGWILTIARHLIVDNYRSNMISPAEMDNLDSIEDERPDSETILVTKELTGQVIKALLSLRVNHREMLVLRYVLGWRVTRIAEYLEMPENTVSVSIHRALNHLQNLLLVQGVSNE